MLSVGQTNYPRLSLSVLFDVINIRNLVYSDINLIKVLWKIESNGEESSSISDVRSLDSESACTLAMLFNLSVLQCNSSR